MPFAANSYLAYLRAQGASSASPAALKPYAALADDLSDPRTYALTIAACDNMAGILAVGTAGEVMIGHHFLFDMKTPFAVEGSDQLIMLTGRLTVDNPVSIAPATGLAMQRNRNFPCPSWADLALAPDGDAVKAVTPARANPTLFTGGNRPFFPIPPWLAAALMDANTTNAADLCVIAIRTIRDFDTRAITSPAAAATTDLAEISQTPPSASTGTADDADDDDAPILVPNPADSAQAILWRVPAFLWAVATKNIAGCTASIADTPSVERWCTTIRARCFGNQSGNICAPTPTPTPELRPNQVTPPSSDLEMRFGSALMSMERHFQLADERAAREKEEKDSKTFAKLEPYTRSMILFISERIEVEDESGDIHLDIRPKPTESYSQLLQLGNVAQAKMHMDHIIQTVHKCPVSLPLATVNAILHGRFTWSEETNPEAFSIFACFAPEPSAINAEADDYLALQLKSAEGQGLSDSDVSRSTKVILKVPRTEHQLAEFIGAFALVLSTLFGPSAPIHLAVQGWIPHIRENQMVYAQLLRADPAFGCRVLALIDRALQLYFRACLDPARRQGAERLLLFETYQSQIIMNTFSYPVLPAAIARLIQSSNPAASSLTSTTSTHSTSSPSPSSPVFNHDRLPSFRAASDSVLILQNRVSTAPLWTTCQPPCRPCPKYHSGGECTTACPRAATHRPPTDEDISSYQNWVASTLRRSTTNPNTGRNPPSTSNRRSSPHSDPNSSTKRQRPNSPKPDGGTTTRRVHFNKDKGNEGPDF